MKRNYRIKDIAELAGVSTGTVDRILHNRGKVSEEAQKKVEKVLKEIDYHPNLIARSLALQKTFRFFVLMPTYAKGEYWAKFAEGIRKAEADLFSYNIEIHWLCFDQYDNESFARQASQLEKSDCQGAVIATLFQANVKELTGRMDKKNIPYVLVDAYIEDIRSLSYYGTHSYDSGYLAGRLMMEQIGPHDDLAVFRFIRKGNIRSPQVQKREEGFRAYLTEHAFAGHIHPVHIHADKPETNWELLDAFFSAYKQVQAGVIFNSRAHLLGDYFSRHAPGNPFRLIGYDVIEANVNYLHTGYITHLIAQRPEVQGASSIKALFQHLFLHQPVEPVNYMPLDILVKENIRYYNNYI